MSVPHVSTDYQAVAWKNGRNFTKRWHLERKDDLGKTLCLRWIPEGALISRRPILIHDCEGCEQVRQFEVLKQLEAGR